MKSILDLDRDIQSNPELKEIAMDLMQKLFTRTQENLVVPVPWGDENKSSQRKPTIISDQSLLLLSAVPPYWDTPTRIAFRYDAPHSTDVEYGSPPKRVSFKVIHKWVERKLDIHGYGAVKFANNIVKQIKREGIPPHPYIRPAVEQITKEEKLFRIRVGT